MDCRTPYLSGTVVASEGTMTVQAAQSVVNRSIQRFMSTNESPSSVKAMAKSP